MSFSFKDRDAALASLEGDPPELLIIGGGIVGVSAAAHAARLGLRVLLVEKDDFASGASGHSTGLAHAGLRYLAQGRIGYVFHEGRERRRLQELAPQWVRPFPFILPVYRGNPYPFWLQRMGTWLYDALGWCDALLTRTPLVRRHRTLSARDVLAKVPGLAREGLLGGIEYYVDARLDDSRFTLGYAQQAAGWGARLLTHCRVGGIELLLNKEPLVHLQDVFSGRTYKVLPKLVLNTAGAWIDEIRQQAGLTGAQLMPSKGIHLLVDRIADKPLILSASVKGKVFFVLPVDAGQSLVGTTDTAVSGRIDDVKAEADDIAELLRQLFHYFPHLKEGDTLPKAIEQYKRTHLRSFYCGVRPLLAQQGTSTLHASREHLLVKELPQFWSFAGVKLTAGRVAGEQAAQDAWAFLRAGIPKPIYEMDSLPGGELWDMDRFVRDAQKRFNLGPHSEERLRYLVLMYGARYVQVLALSQADPQLGMPVMPGEPWVLAQAAYAAREEMVLTLNDFLWRRTKWARYADLPAEALEAIARILGQELQWSEERIAQELQDYHTEKKKHQL